MWPRPYGLLLRRWTFQRSNASPNVMNQIGLATPPTLPWTIINKATRMKRERMAIPMQIRMCQMRKSSTLEPLQTSEVEDGEEGETVPVQVSAGDGLSQGNPTHINKEALNKEPQRMLMQRALLRQRRVLAQPQSPMTSNNKLLPVALIPCGRGATNLGIFPRFATIQIGEGNVGMFQINWHNVRNLHSMLPPIRVRFLRRMPPSPLQEPIVVTYNF